jgi:quercetin dioxygenase-like cupin family protein
MQAHDWESVPLERLTDKISRRIIVGVRVMLVRWEFKAGGIAARHSHPHEQVVMMVSGKLRLGVGDDETIMKPNDVVVIPSGTPHEAEALEDTVVIDIFSPPREDFQTRDLPSYLK